MYKAVAVGAYRLINLGRTVLGCLVTEEEVRQWQPVPPPGDVIYAEKCDNGN